MASCLAAITLACILALSVFLASSTLTSAFLDSSFFVAATVALSSSS